MACAEEKIENEEREIEHLRAQIEKLRRMLFYVGNLKGVGRIYQQTFVDTYSKVAHCKLYTSKTPITAADLEYCRSTRLRNCRC